MPDAAAKPSLLRAINLRTTFQLVQAHGPVAAPRIVQLTGLSKPTVSEVLGQLVELGMLQRVGRTRGAPGPTAQLYDVHPRAGHVLCIDVGRTWVRIALSDLRGRVVARHDGRTRQSARAVIAEMRSVAAAVTAEAGTTLEHLQQIVVGTPGVVRPGDSHLSLAPQLPGFERPQVLSAIREALPAPLLFENDVNLAAVGEHTQGVAAGIDDFVMISVGTGVGMAAIVDGALRRGASGLAGEIGYLPLWIGDPHRDGAQVGSFEQLVSASAVVEVAAAQGVRPYDGAAGVFAAAREGDATARRAVEEIALRFAHGLAAVAAVLDPELVVLGGGIGAGAGDLLVPLVSERLARIAPFSPRLAVSTLGPDAVLVGAQATALRLAFDRIFGPGTVLHGATPAVRRDHAPAEATA